MRKRILKKSEVLHEGYIKGLKKAQTIIESMLDDENGNVDNEKLNEELCKACQLARDVYEIQELIDEGADVNYGVNEGGSLLGTPLMNATANKKGAGPQIISFLVDNGADVNAITYGHHEHLMVARITPLMVAAHHGTPETIKALVKEGADLEAVNSMGETALHTACQYGKFKNAKALLSLGANVNAKNNRGKVPLYTASVYNSHEPTIFPLLKLLLDAGSEITTRTIGDLSDEMYEKVLGHIWRRYDEETEANPDVFDEWRAQMRKWRRTTDFDDPNRPDPPAEPHTKWGDILTVLGVKD